MSSADSRALLTALYEAAVQGASPFDRTRDAVSSWCRTRGVAPGVPVYLFALGKAAPAMAAGAISALAAARLSVAGGIVVTAHTPRDAEWHGLTLPDTVTVREGDHPVPGPRSLAAADAIEDLAHSMEPDAIALVLLSGGTTALCAAPIPALSQVVGDAEQAQAYLANLAQTLLESGLAIHEMNAIRRRVLRFGAGRLATMLTACGASHVATFAVSDVIGDDPTIIGSGPCSADPFDDATFLALLDAHDLRPRLQRAMAQVLGIAGDGPPPAVPSAVHPAFTRVDYTLVARNADAVQALAEAAPSLGVSRVEVDDVPLQGDAATLGDLFAHRALQRAQALAPGEVTLLVAGGEPVVNLRDTIERAMQAGDEDDARLDEFAAIGAPFVPPPSLADEPLRGGRMQVFALAASLGLEHAVSRGDRRASRITVLAAGTDGRDGPTDAAGAIVDAAVPALARRAGRVPERDLLTGHSWFPLDAAGALLRTGPTGTNVMDVVAVLLRG